MLRLCIYADNLHTFPREGGIYDQDIFFMSCFDIYWNVKQECLAQQAEELKHG